ncbi:(Na+)-NQR maturation NqrM [Thalassotalea maritima]|uniref:(Na+)-NQR maturation NqrM n=1 Tax=Thalassotalea maritima TaxID=3242416 RepID=UPI003527D5A8
MTLFLLTFGFFMVIVVAMAIGYILQKKTLAGSCGGLGSIGIDKACNCDNPCEKRKERERKAALKENAIDIKNI